MESNWDSFAKSLADESLPRRESLRRIGLLVTATLLSPLGVEFALAGHQPKSPQPQPPKSPRPATPKKPKDPCLEFCIGRNPRQKDQCLKACNDCDGACAFLDGDPDNCGACGNVCP